MMIVFHLEQIRIFVTKSLIGCECKMDVSKLKEYIHDEDVFTSINHINSM